ncbi:MAG: tyrosine-protein kinase [Frankiales bacterium]|nr:tyrosine-protein kinase [Frankiales bacterium]
MAAEGRESLSRVIWRSRWLVAGVTLLVGLTVAVISKRETPVYETTAKLVVNQPDGTDKFGLSDSLQFYARTLGNLVGSQNVADIVVENLSFPISATKARDAMSFSVVTETQLIEVTASDPDPKHAQELANVWASTFTAYAAQKLTQAAPSSVSVADRATVPRNPARPKPTLYTLVGLVFGALLGIAAAIARERLDTRVRNLERLSREFELPVLGVLPRRGSAPSDRVRFLEAVGVLRANLQFSATEVALQTVAVTSSRPEEGKSTVVAELGRSFATVSLVEGSVLLVDADLRRPALGRRLGLDARQVRHSPGLTSYLRGQASFEDAVLSTDMVGLAVMPTGPRPPDPDVVLSFAASRQRLRALSAYAEVLLIDCPPVSVGADVTIVATEVDGVLIVVDPKVARRSELHRVVEQIKRVGGTPLGFVLNRSDEQLGESGYYYDDDDYDEEGGARGRRRRDTRSAPPAALASRLAGHERGMGASGPVPPPPDVDDVPAPEVAAPTREEPLPHPEPSFGSAPLAESAPQAGSEQLRVDDEPAAEPAGSEVLPTEEPAPQASTAEDDPAPAHPQGAGSAEQSSGVRIIAPYGSSRGATGPDSWS